MVLDPRVQRVIESLPGRGMTGFADLTESRAREAVAAGLALQGGADREADRVAEVRELTVAGPDGPLPARSYRPVAPPGAEADAALPVLVFFHGGGFVLGELDLADRPCRALANATGAVVATVRCRRAPEAPFPAAVADAHAAVSWFAEHADELGGDPTRIGVAGDGVGATLAAVVAQLAREHGDPVLALQVLICPAVDFAGRWRSRAEFPAGGPLSSADLAWVTGQYPAAHPDLADPRLSPLRATDLTGLPPAVVVTAGYDPLRDEGQAYATALSQAGVPVLDCRNDTMAHGFLWMAGAGDTAAEVLAEVGGQAREVFATAVSASL
ncbi:MAG TPA: alpha/beta hydrolase [Pseudonocardia sp.]|jgi:acetyl esterase|nr:alpha/beta hydrolase [Pseudonocardia sp.]